MASDLEEAVDRYHRSVQAFVRGDPSPQERLWSRRDDVTLANPIHSLAHGWNEVSNALRSAASQLRDGEVLAFERVSGSSSGDLAYMLEIERHRMKGGGAETADLSLRVTTVLRHEEDGWKILHRHADRVPTPRSVESLALG